MSSQFTVFDPDAGRVKRVGFVSRDNNVGNQAGVGESVLSGVSADQATQRVVDGALVDRPTLNFDKTSIVADGSDTATMTGLPDPCIVEIDGVEQEITGGSLEFTADTPGDYLVEVRDLEAFPAQAFRGTVTAS